MKKILNQTINLKFGEEMYEIFICNKSLDFMNWSWESLVFPDNLDVFAWIKDSQGNVSTLVTSGFIKIHDANGDELDKDDIRTLALNGEIDDCDKYTIDNNNWFAVEYESSASSGVIDDCVFEVAPKDTDSLIDNLIEFHKNFFN